MAYGVAGVFLSMLGLVGTLLYQCYLYLKTGDWHAFAATDACYRYLKFEWCGNPTDWIGLHKALAAFNPAGAFLMLSFVVLLIAVAVEAMEAR